MRNDEKIDIQLNEASEEELTAEELAQQHYNTALRYINIAEHMKQFEEQDKYYHRAIKYLRRARPYMEVRPLLRRSPQEKYAARAEGKIALYEEACQIRDRARTPEDYYSAQTVFERIHRHELKHKIPKRKVSEELYERLGKCTDSEQQAAACGEMAAKKAAEMKRHSLWVSLGFIAVIIALLAFSRTTAFYQCAGAALSCLAIMRPHGTAIRLLTNAPAATMITPIIRNRDMKPLSPPRTVITKTLRTPPMPDFTTLARENYKDSADHLTALEKEDIRQAELGDIVMFANLEWRVLDRTEDQALLIKDKSITDIAFQSEDSPCTWETSSIRRWLNSTFLEENFAEAEINILKDTNVVAEDNPVYHTSAGKDTVDKVFLLSSSEAAGYYDTLHGTETCWWLRTPGASEGSMAFVYPNRTVMNYGYDCTDDTFSVKPVMWVDISQ